MEKNLSLEDQVIHLLQQNEDLRIRVDNYQSLIQYVFITSLSFVEKISPPWKRLLFLVLGKYHWSLDEPDLFDSQWNQWSSLSVVLTQHSLSTCNLRCNGVIYASLFNTVDSPVTNGEYEHKMTEMCWWHDVAHTVGHQLSDIPNIFGLCSSLTRQLSKKEQQQQGELERQSHLSQRLSQEKEELMFKLKHRDSCPSIHLPAIVAELAPRWPYHTGLLITSEHSKIIQCNPNYSR